VVARVLRGSRVCAQVLEQGVGGEAALQQLWVELLSAAAGTARVLHRGWAALTLPRPPRCGQFQLVGRLSPWFARPPLTGQAPVR
jgi:hypothetical protein